MRYEEVRDMLLRQWKYTGGPNETKTADMYHEDAVLEFPQSGEWFQGRASFMAWRERYPAKLDFEPQEIRGSGDLWIAEGVVRYEGVNPIHFVKIIQFDGDQVNRETLYFTEPFPAPEWRKPWATNGPRPRRHDDLPDHIAGGS